MTTSTYPVHVDAHLDPKLSRGLWLVKWLLAIPHYVVLAFLWLGFVVTSAIAFFAILFTGRYPRAIFDYNVGVLRWTWRVTYYAYGALGTDRYPPFSLEERADYPAHLEIDYPEHLSRGLVLVKWWLLAIPHYLVLGLFLGGGAYVAADARQGDQDLVWNTGLVGLLVLVAGVVLLFTGRYPQPVFDLVLGLNRWALRVAGYAALMTDQYPPFRLDQGGEDPDPGRLRMAAAPPDLDYAWPPVSAAAGPSARPSPSNGPPTTPPSTWGAGRITALILGSLLLLASLGLGAGGLTLAIADNSLRDDGGFLMSPDDRFSTSSYAMTTESMEIHANGGAEPVPQRLLGDAKLTAVASGGAALFVGVAPTADVQSYLDGVGYATVVGFDNEDPVYRTSDGGAPAQPPTESDIWVAQASGTGTQSVVWPIENGDWSVVVMNADGSRGVSADLSAGATVPALGWLVTGVLVSATVGLVLAIALLAGTLIRRSTRQGT